MAAHTEPENWFRFSWPSSANDRRFEGEISADGFHVRRVIGYRNSFLPVIDATVRDAGRGSRVEVRMRPFYFVYAFAAIWVLAVTIGFVTYGQLIGLVFAALMILFVYAMTMGGFWFEANKQERTLREIFQARTP